MIVLLLVAILALLVLLQKDPHVDDFDFPTRLHVVAVATDPSKADVLVDSARRRGIRVRLLKSAASMGHQGQTGGHFGMKIMAMRNFLKNVHDDDIVLFVDAYDVLIDADEQRILDVFHRLTKGRDLALFSAEAYCWPDPERAPEYERKPGFKGRYLNSGCYMGYVRTLKRLFSRMGRVETVDDDQRVFTDAYLRGEDIQLDSGCDLCVNVAGSEKDLALTRLGWMFRPTGALPCVLHGNGPGKKFWSNKMVPSVFGKPGTR